MEKKFSYDHAISCEVLFEIADVFVAIFPNFFANQFWRQFLLRQKFGMHPDDEHLFVVTAIENSYLSPVRETFHAPPEIIMVEVLVRWRFEGIYLATLWIHA